MEWNLDAPVFVPRQSGSLTEQPGSSISTSGESSRNGDKTEAPRYSDVASASLIQRSLSSLDLAPNETGESGELCPYFYEKGECGEQEKCPHVHGLLCKHCKRYCLPPNDTKMRKFHETVCAEIKSREKQYYEAAEASKDMSCAVCYEVVLEKEDKKKRKFGLLSECNHTFCLECIRKWRSSKTNEGARRNCPICRKLSYFIIPSEVWVSDAAEKDRLVQGYKEHLASKDCMHFNKGKDHCPFGANCFYRHALPDGTIVADNVVRRPMNANGDHVVMTTPLLSEFLEELLSFSANASQLQTLRVIFQEFNAGL